MAYNHLQTIGDIVIRNRWDFKNNYNDEQTKANLKLIERLDSFIYKGHGKTAVNIIKNKFDASVMANVGAYLAMSKQFDLWQAEYIRIQTLRKLYVMAVANFLKDND